MSCMSHEEQHFYIHGVPFSLLIKKIIKISAAWETLDHSTENGKGSPLQSCLPSEPHTCCAGKGVCLIHPEGTASSVQQSRGIKHRMLDKEVDWIPASNEEPCKYVFIFSNQSYGYVKISLGLLFLIKGSNSCEMFQKLERDAQNKGAANITITATIILKELESLWWEFQCVYNKCKAQVQRWKQ